MDILILEGYVSYLVTIVLLAVKIFAFANALMWSSNSYEAAGKLTKPAWAVILGVGVVLQLVPIFWILNIAFIVAAFVYLADVRPALTSLRRR